MTSTEEQASGASLSERINSHVINLYCHSKNDIKPRNGRGATGKALEIKEVENLAVLDIKIQKFTPGKIELIRNELLLKLKPNDIVVQTCEGLNI
jgi:hypothetical protein